MAGPSLPPETLEAFGGDLLRAVVFYEKYALRDLEDRVLESRPEQMWARVARELASVEPDPERRSSWEQAFYWLLEDFKFLPGGRILHGAGNPRKVTLINCYVEAIQGDSLEAIFAAVQNCARTFSRGGGVGTDVSALRPRGAPVHNAARVSTGAVSFMELFSLTTGIIGQAGRRGALMITIADHHPDVLEFCRVKRDLTSVRFANISVRLSDAFLESVERDELWRLWFEGPEVGRIERMIPARHLWQELVQGARDWAEPGVLFWDTVLRLSTSNYGGMEPVTTNPCGEEPLEHGGSCDLGSLNLVRFVRDPFTPQARLDFEQLGRAVEVGVRLLDNVHDYNRGRHALPHQEEASLRARRIGLGITGLADALILLGIRYDSDEGIAFAERIMQFVKERAYRASIALAREKGPFPAFDPDRHLRSPFFRDFPEDILEGIRKHGLRNVSLLTIPPVGSGSAMAGVSNGLEPVFAFSYVRRSESLSQPSFRVLHPAVASYLEVTGQSLELQDLERMEDPEGYLMDRLPPYFVTAHRIDPLRRVEMQAALQRHIDQSISSTINLPRDTPAQTVARIYLHAWRMGLKGVSVYREGSREGILVTPEEARRDSLALLRERVQTLVKQILPDLPEGGGRPEEQIEAVVRALVERVREAPLEGEGLLRGRPERLLGPTYRIPTPFGTAFITITEHAGEPFEVFGRLGKAGSDAEADAEAIGRLCSILLRLRGPGSGLERLQLIVDQLEGIGGSRWLGYGAERVRSIPDAFALALKKYLLDRGVRRATEEQAPPPPGEARESANLCPRCQRWELVTVGGCTVCAHCGFREC
ncbi:MAG: adenosylcobalamin-dependent ribonucleoside-diphosphate reductase [Armatimonadota bacterium]|nr:adenosylcobalamin-dependent ribonucleoside-diphosphate reductase [Armatimonadota bacterium]MDR7563553.1 adenosylcobalamin-dependent ribonucleoside-diphosphate reductase [Armatimonadota bacterium]MDR7567829.1 adenosylcobalamin-dependent ribonucleoside-diphosphate reductase [Armatimonadota bacterium]MDR7601080.1 adenosylcobalamin-dependent ribonucleoside-diphosphate reductase [Armatimonadota bacterium]